MRGVVVSCVSLLMLAGAFGCGSSSDEPAAEPATGPQEPIELLNEGKFDDATTSFVFYLHGDTPSPDSFVFVVNCEQSEGCDIRLTFGIQWDRGLEQQAVDAKVTVKHATEDASESYDVRIACQGDCVTEQQKAYVGLLGRSKGKYIITLAPTAWEVRARTPMFAMAKWDRPGWYTCEGYHIEACSENECAEGESGCIGTDRAWTCVFGDTAWQKHESICGTGTSCFDGVCE